MSSYCMNNPVSRVWARQEDYNPLRHSVEYLSVMSAGARLQELISDVSENGGASRRDAALGDQSEKAGEKLAEIDRR